MKNLYRPVWLSGAGVALALASFPVSHVLHWYAVSICLSVAGVSCGVCGLLWARLEERKVIDEHVRRRRG